MLIVFHKTSKKIASTRKRTPKIIQQNVSSKTNEKTLVGDKKKKKHLLCHKKTKALHCVKNVSIRSFLWSIFSSIRTEYVEILRISPYSIRMRENKYQKNSEHGHFSRST